MEEQDEKRQSKEDAELGKTMGRIFGDRALATKDLYFETDPQTAALRYPFDKRSIEILGLEKWRQVNKIEDD
jgi:hypothetical protein